MPRPSISSGTNAGPVSEALIALVRLLARQAAAEAASSSGDNEAAVSVQKVNGADE